MAHVLAKDLRDSVLEAAFKGDLSTHHATDSRIECYRNEVLNTTRITSKKDITKAIENDELNDMPDIPNNWTYVRLNDVVAIEIKRGKSPKYDEKGEALAFAQKCNSKYDGIQLKLAKHLSNESLSRYKEHENMKDYDIVINSTGGGTLGRVGLYREYYNQLNVPVYPDSHVTIIRAKNNVNSSYLYLYVKKLSPYLETLGEGSTNQTELKPQVLKDLLVPLPPIEEQARIVAKVDEIMAKIDEYEKLENQLVKLKEQFPQDMKDSLLQAGMTGELTNCQPNSTESYSNVFEISGGSQPSKSYFVEAPQEGYVQLYQTRDYGNKPIPVYIPDKFATKKTKEGDILLARYGGSLGKVFIAHDGAYNVAMAKVIQINPGTFLNRFVYYYHLSSEYQDFCRKVSNGRSAQAGFNKDDIATLSVNIFSIEEQRRIVDKLDEVLPLVDKLAELN